MNRILIKSFLLLLLVQLFQECANPVNPTGGPKDTIPPLLISSKPQLEELNYSSNTIELEFSEMVTADKLKTDLVITPITETKFSQLVKKNKVIIKFEEPFSDSTTYTFNFFKGITDITEKNPPENLVLAFSTGDYIDSLSVSGNIKDLLSLKDEQGILVGLYVNTDTLDYEKEKPKYFTTSIESGIFKINNIKVDTYRLFAFKDDNGNALFDPDKESHGFISGEIQLNQNIDSLEVFMQLIDVTEFQRISARPFGRYFDIRYNKEIMDYSLLRIDTGKISPMSKLNEDKTTVRIYNSLGIEPSVDSVGIIIKARDTTNTYLNDTLYVLFNESSRKSDPFTAVSNVRISSDNIVYGEIDFSKPVDTLSRDLIRFQADTLFSQVILNDSNYQWNFNRTQLKFSETFDWKYYNDSVNNYVYKLMRDTSTLATEDDSIDYRYKEFRTVLTDFPKGSFISIESDTLEEFSAKLSRINTAEFGVIRLKINTFQESFILKLLDSKGNTVREFANEKQKQLNLIPPGTYSIKIFIDTNNDGQWKPGDLLNDIEPEPIYIYPQSTELRANWEVSIEDIYF